MTNEKLSYVETVNPNICIKLSQISYRQFLSLYNDNDNENIDENGNISTDIKTYNQFKIIKEYCSNMVSNNYKLTTTYKYANLKTYGRIFVENMGLQRISSKIRGILCDNMNYDFDMINAHPTILLYLCKLHNIQCYELERYVNNRTFILNEFMIEENKSHSDAKLAFIISINKSLSITKLYKSDSKIMINIKNKFFLAYDKEIKLIQKSLISFYPEIYKDLCSKGLENINGRFTNVLMCKIENEILQKIINYTIIIFNVVVNVPMFDGLMLDKLSIDSKNLDLKIIVEKFDNLCFEYGIKWSVKTHNTEILEKLNSFTLEDNIFSYVGSDEVDVANYILNNIIKNKIYLCNGELWIYNKFIWYKNNPNKILSPIISKHDLYISTNKEDKPINKTNKDLINLINLVSNLAPQIDDFYKLMYESTLYKICYKNGFYSFKQNCFIPYTNDNIPFTSFIIDRDYVIDYSKIIEIYERVIYPIFNVSKDDKGDVIQNYYYKNMKYILHKLSRMIAGHIEDKDFILFLGERNSGKGVLEGIFKETFDKYINSFDTSNLIQKPISAGESSKESAWQQSFEFSRIMFGSEIDCKTIRGKHIVKLNGILIKKLISGGDALTARGMRENARSFKIQSSIVLTANDIPKCEPSDAMEFCRVFDMPCRFLNDEAINDLSEDYKKCVIIKKADINIKEFLKLESVKNSFQYILYEAYKNIEPIPMKENEDINDNDFNNEYSDLISKFIITENENDIIKNKEIQSILEEHNISFSLIKAQKYLKAIGAKPYKTNFERGLSCLKFIGNLGEF